MLLFLLLLLSSLSIAGDQQKRIRFATKKYGKGNKEVELFVNFFKINLNPSTTPYFHYNIEITENYTSLINGANKPANARPRRIPKQVNDKVFIEIFKRFKKFQTDCLPAFDGSKNFYSKTKFDLENGKWSGAIAIKENEKELKFLIDITTPEHSHSQNFYLKTADPNSRNYQVQIGRDVLKVSIII